MTKKGFFLTAMLLLCTFHASAKNHVKEQLLANVFKSLSSAPTAIVTDVSYTGDFSSECSAFAWQRAGGAGWTRGKRITVTGNYSDEFDRIKSLFNQFSQQQRVICKETNLATYFEKSRTFYGVEWDKASRHLYFIKATAEQSICIPIDWTTRDYYKGPQPRPRKKPFVSRLPKRQQRQLAVARLWASVKQNFVFMDRVRLDWDSLYAVTAEQMRHVRNDYEATRLLQRMAAQLQDGHTFVWGDDGKHAIMPAPFTTKFLGGKVYIDRIMSSDMIKRGIQRGMELVSIDGQAVKDYAMKQIAPYVSSSTPQWTHHHTYEGYNLTKKPEGKSIRLKLRDGEQTHTIKYTIGDADWDLQEQNGLLHFSLLDNHVGYLRIESFNDSRVCQQFDTLYPRILETHALIIDLRDNGGGNSGNGDYILTHLSKDSIKTDSWRSPMYIPAYASWNMKQPWYESHSEYMQPAKGKTIYTKPIILLVNAGTFSAAEDFVSLFRGMKRGLIVGEPTGGSTGNGVRVELQPGVSYANICSKHDTAPDGTEFVGIGHKPDVTASETYDSYFNAPRDNAISTALGLLKE